MIRNKPTSRHVRILSSGAAVLALTAPFTAVVAQENAVDEPRSRSLVEHSWTLETSVFATDNFRRLSDELTRVNISEERPVGLDPETNEPIFSPFAATEDVSVDTPDNTVLSGTLSGSTLIRRPIISALISGSVTIGSFLNSDDLDQRLLDSAEPGVPETDLFDIPGLDDPVELPVESATFGLPQRDETFVDPNIRAAGTMKLVDNLFYLDAGALVTEQNLGFGGSLAQEGVGQSGDEIVYGGVSISPYLFHSFTDDSSIEVRFRATAIDVLREDIDLSRNQRFTEEELIALEDAQVENDSRSSEIVAEYKSGDLFDRVEFQLGAFGRQVTEDGSDLPNSEEVDFTQASGSLDMAYGVNRSFSLTAGVGVDDVAFEDISISELIIPDGATDDEIAALQAAQQALIDSQTEQDQREDELSGVFWRVGFRYAPSRRTEVEVSVGERFGGTAIEADIGYRPTSRLRLGLGATRQLDTGLQDFTSGALQLQTQAFQVLTELADGQTATSSNVLDRALSFQGGSFRDVQRGQTGFAAFNRLRASLQGSYRRTNFGLSAQYAETERNGQESSLLSGEASVDRQISRRFSMNGQLRYSVDDGTLGVRDLLLGDEDGTPVTFETTQRLLRIGAQYQIGTQLSLTGQVYQVVRDADENASGTQFDYTENAVGLGLRWAF